MAKIPAYISQLVGDNLKKTRRMALIPWRSE